MSQSNNQASVAQLYQTVMEDVIAGVRDAFLDEGVDEQVLQELKVMWENKLAASKALEKPASNPPPAVVQNNDQVQAGSQGSAGQRLPGAATAAENGASSQPTPNLFPAVHQPNAMVPIQIKIPDQNRCVTIQVPFAAVHSNKLQDVLTPAVLDATMSLPEELIATNLQEKVLAALNYGATQSSVITQAAKQTSVIMSQNQKVKPLNPSVHFDGGVDDSSDEEEEEEDDDEDIDDDIDDKDEEVEEEQEGEGQDEEPLNSDDDVSDNEDSNDKLYDIDNVVVCQYDKITRSRNKWKFHLKDGVMNLNGTDYVFQKATGDAEW